MMKRLMAIFWAFAIGVSMFFAGAAKTEASAVNATMQVVPTTKRVSRKTYRKGHWVTVTTYRHGKKITKKTWVKGNSIGHKTVTKTKEIMMGPKKKP